MITKGVFAWLLTRPDNWQIQIAAMLHLLDLSDYLWQKTVSKELQAAGYLTITRSRAPSGAIEWRYDIYSEPIQPQAPAPAPVDVVLDNLPPDLHDTFARLTKYLSIDDKSNIKDELAGQIRAGTVKKPEALLRTLIKALADGSLTLDAARAERGRLVAASRQTQNVAVPPPPDDRYQVAGTAILAAQRALSQRRKSLGAHDGA